MSWRRPTKRARAGAAGAGAGARAAGALAAGALAAGGADRFFSFKLGENKGVPQGLHEAVATMATGERARLVLRAAKVRCPRPRPARRGGAGRLRARP